MNVKIRKWLAYVLTLCMVLSMLPMTALPVQAVGTTPVNVTYNPNQNPGTIPGERSAVSLGYPGFNREFAYENNSMTNANLDISDALLFGKYTTESNEQIDIPWIFFGDVDSVGSTEGDILLSKYTLGESVFDADDIYNGYYIDIGTSGDHRRSSDLFYYMTETIWGEYFYNGYKLYNSNLNAGIVDNLTSRSSSPYTVMHDGHSYNGQDIPFFPLSITDLESFRPAYSSLHNIEKLMTGDIEDQSNLSHWYTRDSGNFESFGGVVAFDSGYYYINAGLGGQGFSYGPLDFPFPIRPAFIIDKSQIMYSYVDGTDFSDATMPKFVAEMPTQAGAQDWRAVYKNPENNTFSLAENNPIVATQTNEGTQLAISWTNTPIYQSSEGKSYISLMIVDENNEVTHYARIEEVNSSNGSNTKATLPIDVEGDVRIVVFNEFVPNSQTLQLPYASNMEEQTITIESRDFDITLEQPTEGGSISTSSTIANAGTEVTVTANPDTYYTVDNIVVTGVTSKEQVKVIGSGNTYTFIMPSEDVKVTSKFVVGTSATERTITLGFDNIDVVNQYDLGSSDTVVIGNAQWHLLDKTNNLMLRETGIAPPNEPGDGYYSEGNSDYRNSHLKNRMSGYYNNLASIEKSLVNAVTLTAGSMWSSSDITNQYFFPLSAVPGEQHYVWDYMDTNSPLANNDEAWWTRTADTTYTYEKSGFVYAIVDGVSDSDIYYQYYHARPAFEMNTDKILFTSENTSGKSVYVAPESEATGVILQETTLSLSNARKITILDDSRNEFSATMSQDASNPQVITINYDGATVGNNEYISVMLLDDRGIVTHYSKLAQVTDSTGTAILTIPLHVAVSGTTLKVFNEQDNGIGKTDISSKFIDLTISPKSDISLHTISGTVKDQDNNPISTGVYLQLKKDGVLIDGNGVAEGMTVLTKSDGTYEILNIPANSSYTLEARAEGYGVNVIDLDVAQADLTQDISFTATATNPTVTVVGGTGSGAYEAGTIVDITATVQSGQRFINWTSSDGGVFGDANSESTTFAVPSNDVIVTANYETIIYSILTVENGSGDGTYEAGTTVDITADTPQSGKRFTNWTSANGGMFGDANSESTTFTLPIDDVTITANYDNVLYTVTYNLNGGSGTVPTQGSLIKDATFEVADYDGTKEGFEFIGWSDGSRIYSIGESYIMGADDVTLTAMWGNNDEPFDNLLVGETYYFDLSGVNVSGSINTALPDHSLNYVPFTYVGKINAYSLDGSNATYGASSDASRNPSDRVLFVSKHNIKDNISWSGLNGSGVIFGIPYNTNYTLRSLSAGIQRNSSTNYITNPANNEWDAILEKADGQPWINWQNKSYAQDTAYHYNYNGYSSVRGGVTAEEFSKVEKTHFYSDVGWRPALEVLNTSELGSDGLKSMTFELNGGHLVETASITSLKIVYTGDTCMAPDGESLTAPTGLKLAGWNTLQNGDGTSYMLDAEVPNTVTTLYAQWADVSVETPTINPNGGDFDTTQSVTIITETADATIYYTTDGTDPTINSTLYTGAFDITEDITIKAIAVKSGLANSNIASATFNDTAPNLIVTGGLLDEDYTYENGVLIIKTSTPLTIKNVDPNTATSDRIVASLGVTANITLEGVNIQTAENPAFGIWDSTANITLAEGTTNTLKSGEDAAGLQVGTNATVTIDGTGTLNTTGGNYGAGIGGGNNGAGGTVTINGGIVNATGGENSSGIGGGHNGDGGAITISGGQVTATKGEHAPYDIGNGIFAENAGTFSTGDNGNAFIYGSIANTSNGSSWSGFVFWSEGTDGYTYGNPVLEEDFTLPAGKKLTVNPSNSLTIPSGVTFTNEGTLVNNHIITGEGTLAGDGVFQTSVVKEEYITSVEDGYDYTGLEISINPTISILGKEFTTLGWTSTIEKQNESDNWVASTVRDMGNYRVRYTKADNADAIKIFSVEDPLVPVTSITIKTPATKTEYTVGDTLDVTNLVITATYSDNSTQDINVTSDIITGFDSSAITDSQTLTITYGRQTTTYDIIILPDLRVIGGTSGLDYTYSNNLLEIKTGTPLTIQNSNPNKATSDMIKVNAGSVSANITLDGVNIHTGEGNDDVAIEVLGTANINLAAGSINKLESDYYRAALEVAEGNSVIIDGTGTLIAGRDGAGSGIGGKLHGNCGEITINGGTITAIGGFGAAGIGSSDDNNNGAITITGGIITAIGGTYAPGIGGGKEGTSTEITITGTPIIIASGGGVRPEGSILNGFIGLHDTDGINIASTLKYADSTSEITDSTAFTNGAGSNVIFTNQYVKIMPTTSIVTSISIKTPATKTEYTVGDALDVTNLVITATYSDNSTQEVHVTASMVSGFDSSSAANNQELTISYEGQTTSYTVNIVAAPEPTYALTVTNGTGSGEYAENEDVTITATVPSGQRFLNWTSDNGGTFVDENSATTTFTMPANATTVTANLENIPVTNHTITASAGANGTISPSGDVSVNDGDNQTFTFTPDNGYEIDTVTVDGSAVTPTGNTYEITNVTDNMTINVTFEVIPPEITDVILSLTAVTVQKGATQDFKATVSGTGDFDDTVTWSIVESGKHADTTISSTGELSVSSDETLTSLTVTATANGDNSKTATAVVTVTDIPVIKHTITASAGNNGSISPNGEQSVSEGSNITFTFTPDNGYEIDTVTVDGSAVAKANSYTFNNVTEIHTINVTFKEIEIVIIPQEISYNTTTITKTEGDGVFTNQLTQTTVNGTISYESSNPKVATVDGNGKVTIVGVGTATITATAEPTATHSQATASYTLTVNTGEVNVGENEVSIFDADFEDLQDVKITVGGKVTPLSRDGKYLIGYEGYTFNNGRVGEVNEGSVEVTLYKEFLATLPAGGYSLAITTSSGTSGGTITGTIPAKTTNNVTIDANGGTGATANTTAQTGDIVTVSAGTRSGYTFSGWTVTAGGVTVENNQFIMLNEDVILTANWKQNSSGSGSSGGGGGGSTSPTEYDVVVTFGSGDGSYEAGDWVTITAEEQEGKTFSHWISDEVEFEDANAETTKFEMIDEDVEVTAVYVDEDESSQTEMMFKDVNSSDWFYEYVMYVFEKGIMTGTSEDEFSPNLSSTRSMVWTVLARLSGDELNETDVWYEAGQKWAMENDVSDGTEPDGNITREQFVTMLYRYEAPEMVTAQTLLGQFSDESEISEYAVSAMEWAVANGIITGKTETTLDPKGELTRAEMATILSRFIEKE